MSRVLVEGRKAGKLLLIDADPAMGLLTALGIAVRRTMGQVREEIIQTAQRGKEEEKAQLVDTLDYMAFEANRFFRGEPKGLPLFLCAF